MATNKVYGYTEELARVWVLPTTKQSGVPVISASNQPGVTLTASGDATKSQTVGPYTLSGIPNGGVGLTGKETSVATDGTWDFTVTGGLTTTPNNTLVYYVVADGSLTLTAGSNVKFGVVDYPKDYVKVAGILPVKIGVFA